jgi:hypothetical protein
VNCWNCDANMQYMSRDYIGRSDKNKNSSGSGRPRVKFLQYETNILGTVHGGLVGCGAVWTSKLVLRPWRWRQYISPKHGTHLQVHTVAQPGRSPWTSSPPWELPSFSTVFDYQYAVSLHAFGVYQNSKPIFELRSFVNILQDSTDMGKVLGARDLHEPKFENFTRLEDYLARPSPSLTSFHSSPNEARYICNLPWLSYISFFFFLLKYQ